MKYLSVYLFTNNLQYKIQINVIISQCVGGSKKPPGRYYSYHSVITIISPCPEIFKVVARVHNIKKYELLIITM